MSDLLSLVRDTAHFLNTLISDEENGKEPYFDERAAKALVCRLFASEAFTTEPRVRPQDGKLAHWAQLFETLPLPAPEPPRVQRSEPGGYAEPTIKPSR